MKILRRIFLSAACLTGFGVSALTAADASPASTTTVSKAVEPPTVENGYLKLGFDRLASFEFVPPAFNGAADGKNPAQTGEAQIPAAVKSWNGKKAVITGFMVPVKMDKGLATEFLVMRNTMACCFGGVPNITDWVVVKMKKGGVPVMMDLPVDFYGELKVGPFFENGYLNGIYQLECERMGEVKS